MVHPQTGNSCSGVPGGTAQVCRWGGGAGLSNFSERDADRRTGGNKQSGWKGWGRKVLHHDTSSCEWSAMLPVSESESCHRILTFCFPPWKKSEACTNQVFHQGFDVNFKLVWDCCLPSSPQSHCINKQAYISLNCHVREIEKLMFEALFAPHSCGNLEITSGIVSWLLYLTIISWFVPRWSLLKEQHENKNEQVKIIVLLWSRFLYN